MYDIVFWSHGKNETDRFLPLVREWITGRDIHHDTDIWISKMWVKNGWGELT